MTLLFSVSVCTSVWQADPTHRACGEAGERDQNPDTVLAQWTKALLLEPTFPMFFTRLTDDLSKRQNCYIFKLQNELIIYGSLCRLCFCGVLVQCVFLSDSCSLPLPRTLQGGGGEEQGRPRWPKQTTPLCRSWMEALVASRSSNLHVVAWRLCLVVFIHLHLVI